MIQDKCESYMIGSLARVAGTCNPHLALKAGDVRK